MEKLYEVAVIGALGKMGRGISLLLLLEQAWCALKDKRSYTLHLIDPNILEARHVRAFFRKELKRSAERRIVELREALKDETDLVSNEEMIQAFVERAMDGIEISAELAAAKTSSLIFEAAFESIEFKVRLFEYLREHTLKSAWFFTNTSSIPIHLLNEKAHLEGRIIGFHFYNPPTVQRLMEVIPLENGRPELKEEALNLAKRLKKTVILSHDVAGFIGNGYFFREIAFALEQVSVASEKWGQERAIVAVDRLTREWLLRPMGIFQLLDFVGLDVCYSIANIMGYTFPLLNQWLESSLKGGSQADGSPKTGLFSYRGHVPEQIFSIKEKRYIPLPDTDFLGIRPFPASWKELHKDPRKSQEIKRYFEALFKETSEGALLSKQWLAQSRLFMQQLVDGGTASSMKDVADVLKLGFYHIYTSNEIDHVS